VAVQAGLIAAKADVDLKGRDSPRKEAIASGSGSHFKLVHARLLDLEIANMRMMLS
jgi:hypothetical protein